MRNNETIAGDCKNGITDLALCLYWLSKNSGLLYLDGQGKKFVRNSAHPALFGYGKTRHNYALQISKFPLVLHLKPLIPIIG